MDALNEPMMLSRPLGHLERAFWLKDQHMPYHFAVCAEIEGPTTVMGWRVALEAVQRRHPAFSVRIDQDGDDRLRFFPVPDTPLPVRIVTSESARWQTELERELTTPFDAWRAPLARAVVVFRPYRTHLILAAHHSITDTKSLVFAIRDTLQILTGKTLDPLPPLGSLDVLLQPFHTASAAGGSFPPPGTMDVYRVPDGSPPVITGLALDPTLTGTLLHRARVEATTVHGALVAAAVAAARRLSHALQDTTITVGSAVDARTAVGAGEDVALLSAGGSTVVQPDLQNFWDIARFARRSIAPMQAPEAMAGMMQGLGEYLSTHRNITAMGALMAGFRFDINISNLGNLPVETRFGDLTFKRLWGPSILAGFEGEQEIGVATIDGSISLLHTSHTPLSGFLEAMQDHLAAACRQR
jgi:hypothetical protein